jgi:AmiR/NasT family two-component response regulator
MTDMPLRKTASITRSILSKKPCVLLLHPQDGDGLTLLGQLRRIGAHVDMDWPPPREIKSGIDLIFLAILPDVEEIDYPWLHQKPPPIISVTSFESPTIIDEALRIGVMGMLTAPIHANGLLTALIMALHHSKQYKKNAERFARMESKMAHARFVEEAKNIFMRMHDVSESEAYELLRSQAMTCRLPVEDIARDIIHADKILSQALCIKTAKLNGKSRTE